MSIEVSINEIPKYLMDSEFYRNMKNFDEKIMTIPLEYYREIIDIKNNDDLIFYIKLLEFWMVDYIPEQVYEYLLKKNKLLDIEFSDNIISKEINLFFKNDKDEISIYAAKHGNINVLKFMYKKGFFMNHNSHLITASAAENGHLECLIFAKENGCRWNNLTSINAAKNGHFECLKYAIENGCYLDSKIYLLIVENGYLECIKYFYKNYYENMLYYISTISYHGFRSLLIIKGHLECLKYIYEQDSLLNLDIESLYDKSCNDAAEYGQLECLKYLHENGCSWDSDTCSYASYGGHLECLIYLHENGCPWDSDACSNASYGGNLECLIYLCENGCPLNIDECLETINSHAQELVKNKYLEYMKCCEYLDKYRLN